MFLTVWEMEGIKTEKTPFQQLIQCILWDIYSLSLNILVHMDVYFTIFKCVVWPYPIIFLTTSLVATLMAMTMSTKSFPLSAILLRASPKITDQTIRPIVLSPSIYLPTRRTSFWNEMRKSVRTTVQQHLHVSLIITVNANLIMTKGKCFTPTMEALYSPSSISTSTFWVLY